MLQFLGGARYFSFLQTVQTGSRNSPTPSIQQLPGINRMQPVHSTQPTPKCDELHLRPHMPSWHDWEQLWLCL